MTVRRGEIYFIDLNPVRGREQGGRRPVLVVSGAAINMRPLVITVVPGTDGSNVPRDHPHSVRVAPDDSGLPQETVFLCFQIRATDPRRFLTPPAGQVTDSVMESIEDALRPAWNFPEPFGVDRYVSAASSAPAHRAVTSSAIAASASARWPSPRC